MRLVCSQGGREHDMSIAVNEDKLFQGCRIRSCLYYSFVEISSLQNLVTVFIFMKKECKLPIKCLPRSNALIETSLSELKRFFHKELAIRSYIIFV